MSYRYDRILQSDKRIYDAVTKLSGDSAFEQTVNSVIAPVLVMYTDWILSEAQKHGIRRLYFLARDGYLMYHIADRLCRSHHIPIKCSYFYCSRYALRMAAYRFYDDSAYEKLFINSYKLTAKTMLERAGFNENERALIYDDIHFNKPETAVMGRSDFSRFCESVKCSIQFHDILKAKSDHAYRSVMSYIKQEGIYDETKIGIVDLGWTGSLQYTLKRLLNSSGHRIRLYGFYMGMLDTPPKVKDSSYLVWLFDSENDLRKAWFSQNLMECICSAPHGMTTGYTVLNGKWIPRLTKSENYPQLIEFIREQSEQLSDYAFHRDDKIALRLLRKLMLSPTEEEVKAFGSYRFCDDVGEQYHRSIVQKAGANTFRRQILPFKILYKDSSDGFYWYYGSVQASSLIIKTFYRYVYLFTRYTVMRAKRG